MPELTLNVITDFLKGKGYDRFANVNAVNDFTFERYNPKNLTTSKIYIAMTPNGWVLYSDVLWFSAMIGRNRNPVFDFTKERNELTETCKELYKMGVLAIGKYGGK